MAALDSERGSISFSMSEPSLREQAPPSLRRAGPLREKFIAANDREEKPPEHIVNDGGRDRDEERQGLEMVKRQKPFPELKPSYAHHLQRASFNQEWIREQRAARIHQYEAQRKIVQPQKQRSEPLLER